MEYKKKPRLELPSESEDSETDSDISSSQSSSSIVRCSSLPSLTTSSTTPFDVAPRHTHNVAPSVPIISRPNSSFPNLTTPVTCNASTPSTSNLHLSSPNSVSSDPNHDGEQLRSSFRSVCNEINQDLEIIMHPIKANQDTLKAIEDYLVILSRKATQPFKVDLTDDSYSTKVSLKVDKNKVIVFSRNTTNQEGPNNQQPSEGATNNAPGPSRVVQNSGGAYWMPPVNPFTSSVTLRQHLEAASNVRPRRMRPPPGFHPTPQYNANLGVGASGVDVQNSSSGVRPPPGFHGNVGNSPPISPGASNAAIPGPNTSFLQEYYGILDTQAIITDLYRQSLSVVRQNALMAASSPVNVCTTAPDQLMYRIIPRQVAESERRPPPQCSQGYRNPQQTTQAQYGCGQPQDPMQGNSGARGNELWQHYTNAAAASGSSVGGNGTGYWDDFLQTEVYDNATSDQYSDLWKQFEDYQRVHYAPGSLRTGSSIFSSDKTGPSKHGPVGNCRPRTQPQGRRISARPTDNTSTHRNTTQPINPPHLSCGQMKSCAQEVLTLSDRFKNASISNQSITRIQNRNALLGALLKRRLNERIARTFGTITTPTVIANGNAVLPHQDQSDAVPPLIDITNDLVDLSTNEVEQVPCSYCTQNNMPPGVPTHVLRDVHGRTVCPVLRNKTCPICNQAGDNAHTVHDCPVRKQWNLDDDKGAGL